MKQKSLPRSFFALLLVAGSVFIESACKTVKEYQKNRLNDAEMTLSSRKVDKPIENFESYREGASGANSGKLGGGCGCN